jgi:hypothetical protein
MDVVLKERKDFFGAGSQFSFRKLVPFFYVSFYYTEKFLAQSIAHSGGLSLVLARYCSVYRVKGGFTVAGPGISGRT